MTVIGLLFLHIVQIVLLFNLPSDFILPKLTDNDSLLVKYLMGGFYFGILILIFYKIISREKVLSIEVTEVEIKKGKKVLIVYFLVDMILFVLLAIFHEAQVGRLHL